MDKYSHRYTIVCTDMNKDYRMNPAAVLLYFQESFARFICHDLSPTPSAAENTFPLP